MNYFKDFVENTDHRKLCKWIHYFEVYERELSHLRDKDISFLEIGVYKGGSIPMWKGFFKKASNLIFIDIEESCSALQENGTNVLIGDQSDETFLSKVIQDYGPFDVVIDDGSHLCSHQIISFEKLWPALTDNGIYIVEDTHSSYWPGFGGGYRNESSFIEYSKRLVDKMHSWWTDQDDVFPYDPFGQKINGVRFYDSMVVLTKRADRERPIEIEVANGKIAASRNAFELRGRKSIFK